MTGAGNNRPDPFFLNTHFSGDLKVSDLARLKTRENKRKTSVKQKKHQGYVKGKTEKPQDYCKGETNTKIRQDYGKGNAKTPRLHQG